jgi:hypothetical protein
MNVSGNYIAGDYFANAQSKEDVLQQLEQLPRLISQAVEKGGLNEEKALDVKYNIEKAVVTAKKPESNKAGVIDYINSAKGLLEGLTSVNGLVTAFTKAIEAVHKFF